jgi:T5SS/PEP-CTERM-associated repeat protein
VSGTGSVLSVVAGVVLGWNGPGQNTVTVERGGRLEQTGNGDVLVGFQSRAHSNTLVMAGPGSALAIANRNQGWTYVGQWSSWNRMIVTNGAVATTALHSIIGKYGQSFSNEVVVSGANSVWSMLGELAVGEGGGSNTLTVSEGGRVFCGTAWMGTGGGSVNQMQVTGAGSSLLVSNVVEVGVYGSGNRLGIGQGGWVSCTTGVVGRYSASGRNSATIEGSGSTWTNRSLFLLGDEGSRNTMFIGQGGLLVSTGGYVSVSAGAISNSMTIADAGSAWRTGDLYVGYSGRWSRVAVSNGAALNTAAAWLGHAAGAGWNEVFVTGAGSAWTNAKDIYIGYGGPSNSLTVAQGGEARARAAYIGYLVGAAGNAVVVTGSNSLLSVSNACVVGSLGYSNELVVADGGRLAVSSPAGTAGLTIDEGDLRIEGGQVAADSLVAFRANGRILFRAGRLEIGGANVFNNGNVAVGDGTRAAVLELLPTTNLVYFGGGLTIRNQGLLIGRGGLFSDVALAGGGGVSPGGTNAGALAVTSLTFNAAAEYWYDVGGATQDLIRVDNQVTFGQFPVTTNVLHLRNLGGADWNTPHTVLQYAFKGAADAAWSIDYGTSGMTNMTVRHDSGAKRYVLEVTANNGVPYVNVTNADATVASGVASCTIGGTNNAHVTGILRWTNALTGTGGTQAAATPWTISGIALGYGANPIAVYGTNAWGLAAGDTVTVTRLSPPPPPFVDVTSTSAVVSASVAGYGLQGTNNAEVVGTMWITNATAGGARLTFAAVTPWTSPSIGLTAGANALWVFGTNVAGVVTGDTVVITRIGPFTNASPTHYVSTDGDNVWPYTNWATAARQIQDAVDTARAGDRVLVTNGIYVLSDQVTITNAVAVQSVNGAAFTCVDGNHTNAVSGSRCFTVSNADAYVEGFTIVRGSSTAGGGVLLAAGALHGCIVMSNTVGLAYEEAYGGGVYCGVGGIVRYCTIQGNTAVGRGGGVFCERGATVLNCLVSGNQARSLDTLFAGQGGGVYCASNATVRSCTIAGNRAWDANIGFHSVAGGLYGLRGIVENTVVYANYATDGANWGGDGLGYTNCGTLPAAGSACVTNDPLFVSPSTGNYRLLGGSPCINAGTNRAWMAGAVDLDGAPRVYGGSVDIGAYEDGTPIHYVATNGASVWPYTNWATAARVIQDAVDTAMAGDRVVVSNGVYANGGAVASGALTSRVAITRAMTVHSVSGDAWTTIMGAGPVGGGAVRCAFVTNGAVLSGFTLTNGATFARGAGREVECGGGAWCDRGGTISNCTVRGNAAAWCGGGVYNYQGGLVVDCTVAGNQAQYGGGVHCELAGDVRKSTVADNAVTADGGGAYVYRDGGLEQCTFQGNAATNGGGGGVFCNGGGLVAGCSLTGNSAKYGGGGYCDVAGTLRNCLVVSNSAVDGGGAACYIGGALQNCTVSHNTATGTGGGIRCNGGGAIVNTILYFNQALSDAEWSNVSGGSGYTNCSTFPAIGSGCRTNDPLFVNAASANYRLQPSSPCIDWGRDMGSVPTDIEGVPRPLDGNANGIPNWDIGAYEYVNASADSDLDTMRDAWELAHGLSPIDSSDGTANADGDPFSNADEHTADTDPRSPESYFHVDAISNLPPGRLVYVLSSSNRQYALRYCVNLASNQWPVVADQSNRVGVAGVLTLTDTNGAAGPRFYRVGVSVP